jgi:AraC-like DNA-binding protein
MSEDSAISSSEYRSDSLDESHEILCREWSRHSISVPGSNPIDLRFSHTKLSDDMSVSRLSYGVSVFVDPGDRDEVLLIQMPLSGCATARYDCSEVPFDASTYGVIDVRRLARVHYDADFAALVLRIRVARIRQHLENWIGAPLKHEIVFRDYMEMASSGGQRWAPMVAMLSSFVDQSGTRFPARMFASVEDTVLTSLLLSQPHSFDDEMRHPASLPAPRHVKRAEEYVRAHAMEHISTTTLAVHANVSVRALFDGFQKFRQTTPADFIRSVRLENARADLEEGGQTVSAIAKKWGFSHLGNFAAHYRTRYGESPVDTLRFGSAHIRA